MDAEAALRERYAPPTERARLKVLRRLDRHCREFIARSPFLVLGTAGPDGADVSPKGDRPGFVRVIDDGTLAVPDWPGNNRLDSMTNLLENPNIGMLFLIPGVDETLRVNGTARITDVPELLSQWDNGGRLPKSAIVVTVQEAFLHCAKALVRSRLWKDDYRIERSQLPSYGCMMQDHIGNRQSAEEIDASVAQAIRDHLY